MKNKDKRRAARHYERTSKYKTTRRERTFINHWRESLRRMRELNEAFIEEMDDSVSDENKLMKRIFPNGRPEIKTSIPICYVSELKDLTEALDAE